MYMANSPDTYSIIHIQLYNYYSNTHVRTYIHMYYVHTYVDILHLINKLFPVLDDTDIDRFAIGVRCQ